MSEQLIYKALSNVNEEVKTIVKSHKNETQGFSFRGIDDVMAEIHSLFAKYDIITTQKVLDQKREERPSKSGGLNIWSIVTYEFTFHTIDGSCLSTQMVGEAMDTGDKGNAKCVSIAFKYAIIDMFSIPTKEQGKIDPDRKTTELKLSLTPAQLDTINAAETKEAIIAACSAINRTNKQYKPLLDIEYKRRLKEIGGDYAGA